MFKFETINNKRILKSDLLTNADSFFTTRESVITPSDMPNADELCAENKKNIAQYLGITEEAIISPIQTHSANIDIATKGKLYPDTDALVVTDTNIAIALNFADCTPIVLYDSYCNIGAVAHAGWRGTAASIAQKTIEFMNKNYSTKPENIIALIGPAISMKNYQVDEDVFKKIKITVNKDYDDYFVYDKNTNKYNIDLKTVNLHQLKELGVSRIDMCNYCTYDSIDVFFSYRRENGKTARHSAILKLIKQ